MTQNLADLFESDEVIAEERPYRNFGEFKVDGFKGVLVAGMRGPQRDIEKYPDKKVHVCFEYNFRSIDGKGYPVDRVSLVWDKDWKMIQESLAELWGLDLKQSEDRDVYLYNLSQLTEEGKYIAYEARRTGETYIKQDTGETKYKTSLWILAVYDSYEECLKAHDEWYGIENDDPDEVFANGVTSNPDDVVRATAAKFLEPVVRNARNGNSGVDREKLAQAIANDAGLSEHFTVDSPEVKAVIEKVEASPPF